MTRETFEAGVRTIKEHIAAGDIYQAVLSQRFEADVTADPFTVYRALRHVNPSPYMYFIRMGGLAIVGSSPEMLVRVEGRRVETHPIAGHAAARRERGGGPAARRRAEAQREGARRARDARRSRAQRPRTRLRVRHRSACRSTWRSSATRTSCTSSRRSTARLAEDRDHLDALVACFPAGHRLGRAEDPRDADPRGARADAPRHLRRRGRLHRLRRQPRFLHRDPHDHDPRRRARASRPAPASSPTRTRRRSTKRRATRRGRCCRRSRWRRPGSHVILLIDNYDSFTYNLAQYLGELGAPPLVRRNDEITLDEIEALQPERIVISPGPGRPEDAGHHRSTSSARFGPRLPVLGVCLGHQGIGIAFGGDGRARAAADARQDLVGAARRPRRVPRRLAAVRRRPLSLARRRRAAARRRSKRRRGPTTARSWACGTATFPVHGVQFHPESVLTGEGRQLLRNFLELWMFRRAAREAAAARRTSRSTKRRRAMDEIMEGRAQPAQIAGLLIGAGDEGRAAGRDRRARADDARPRDAAVARVSRRCSTRAAPAATARTRSTSRPSRRSCSRRAACASPSTATDRCRAGAAAPICSRRSASTSRAEPAVVERCLDGGRHRVLLRADVSSVDAARGADAPRARRPHGVQPARSADEPGRARRGSSSACRGRS